VALANAGYRVLRYDQYGRGLSDRPNIEYTADVYDRQLGELLDALHIGARAAGTLTRAARGTIRCLDVMCYHT
jgi:pimeloyl-ACP methyl ester carboxylesterase